jgi:anti-sigma B factor antagonist
MVDPTFHVKVRFQGDKAVLDLSGEINAFADPALMEAFKEADDKDPDTFVLNFEEVDYINSTGIALIVELLGHVRKSKKTMVVYGLSDHYEEIFKLTRLADFMTIYDSQASALAV